MNTEPDTLLPGTLLGGKYRLAGVIGKGGFGAVFRGTSVQSGAPVAVKVLSQRVLAQSGGAERFKREADLASRLKHPNTVRVLDAGEDGQGWLYIAFELLEGESVEQALAERGAMNVDRAASILCDALSALEEAHSIGIIHRDIKPGNIFLARNGLDECVKVLDFGIAKNLNATKAGLTKDGSTMGTPIYMSPEQILGKELTPASDIFSVGMVLADMLLGMSPYGRDPRVLDVITARINATPIPLPDDLARSRAGAIVVRATQDEPSRRFRSAGEMRAALMALAPTMTATSPQRFSPMSTAPTLEVQAVTEPPKRKYGVLDQTMGDEPSYSPPTIRDPSSVPLARTAAEPLAAVAPNPVKKQGVEKRGAATALVVVFVLLVVLGAAAGLLYYFEPSLFKTLLDAPTPKRP